MAKKSWREKLLTAHGLPKVEPLPELWAARRGKAGTLAIPSPMEVYRLMGQVRKGKLTTTTELRQVIARVHNADEGCPLTTGIFAVIAANAAEEYIAEGKKRSIAYWRTLKANGELNAKFPGGIERQAQLLEAEGHTVVFKGSKVYVSEYDKKLFRFV